VSLRSCLRVIASLLGGMILLILGCVGALVVFAGRDCGPAFGHYGCRTLTARSEMKTYRPADQIVRFEP
jgi:hypothetical protein